MKSAFYHVCREQKVIQFEKVEQQVKLTQSYNTNSSKHFLNVKTNIYKIISAVIIEGDT